MKYDELLKSIFFDAMPALLRLMRCAPVVEYLSVEFPPRHKMVADIVALLADGRILHVELQVQNDPEMLWRCYHYFGTIKQKWRGRQVVQVVVYLGSGPMTMENSIDEPDCKYRFDILSLKDVPAEIFLDSPRDAERILAAVSRSADPRATIRQILASWKGMPENELRENVERLRTLSRLRKHEIITTEEVKGMPFEIDVTETELYQLGRLQGEQTGAAVGRTEEARSRLTHFLHRRFTRLPSSISQRIGQANYEQIDQWFDRAIDAQALSDIF